MRTKRKRRSTLSPASGAAGQDRKTRLSCRRPHWGRDPLFPSAGASACGGPLLPSCFSLRASLGCCSTRRASRLRRPAPRPRVRGSRSSIDGSPRPHPSWKRRTAPQSGRSEDRGSHPAPAWLGSRAAEALDLGEVRADEEMRRGEKLSGLLEEQKMWSGEGRKGFQGRGRREEEKGGGGGAPTVGAAGVGSLSAPFAARAGYDAEDGPAGLSHCGERQEPAQDAGGA